MCSTAKKRPDFLCLVHQTDISSIKNIVQSGYLLPPRYVQKRSNMRKNVKPNTDFHKALEGVYFGLIRRSDIGKKLTWFDSNQVILVFSLALLDRNDYYISLRDQYGDMTRHTYTKQTIERFPNVNYNPDVGSHWRNDSLGMNEVMFFEKIPLSFLFEVWLPHTDGMDYHLLNNTSLILDAKNDLSPKVSMLGKPIRFTNEIPQMGQILMDCNSDQSIYEAPFCRSSMYFGGSERLNSINTDTSHLDRVTTLAEKKKIALNCGIPPEIVHQSKNQDYLNYLIRQKESEYLTFLEKNKLTPENEKKFREMYRTERKYYPPFEKEIEGYSDREINESDPFHGLVMKFISFIENEVSLAMKTEEPNLEKKEEYRKDLSNSVFESDDPSFLYMYYGPNKPLELEKNVKSMKLFLDTIDRLYDPKNKDALKKAYEIQKEYELDFDFLLMQRSMFPSENTKEVKKAVLENKRKIYELVNKFRQKVNTLL